VDADFICYLSLEHTKLTAVDSRQLWENIIVEMARTAQSVCDQVTGIIIG
jgi:hypothetical protein